MVLAETPFDLTQVADPPGTVAGRVSSPWEGVGVDRGATSSRGRAGHSSIPTIRGLEVCPGLRHAGRRLNGALLLTAAVLLLCFLPLSGVAEAHSVLASSQPRPGQRLGTAPGVVLLEFTEQLNRSLSRAVVTDPTGQRFTGGASGSQEI